MACRKMLVLCGPTYPSRLWCAWELFTLFSFSDTDEALAKIKMVVVGRADSVSSGFDNDPFSKSNSFRVAEDGTWKAEALRPLDLLLEYDVVSRGSNVPSSNHH